MIPVYLDEIDIDDVSDANHHRIFYDGSHHLHHQYQFHLDKPESKENIKKVLLFLSRNTSSSGVESNESSQNQPTQNTNEVSLYPFDS